MARVLLVDDSPAVRQLLAQRLTDRGYDVSTAGDAIAAAELAMSQPPDVIVTDLWMPGISGVQLCRLVRAEPRTSHVPVVLITGESHRRSRFWAKTAGAAAYVAKEDPAALYETLARLAASFPSRPPEPTRSTSRAPIQHRLFQRLDAALFESVVAGEVRSLAHEEGEAESVFRGLATLASEVAAYRWLALHVAATSRSFVHAHAGARVLAEQEARAALGLGPAVEVTAILDERAVEGSTTSPIVAEVRAGGRLMGTVALGPNERGASRDDRELVSIIARELGGPLRIVSLVEQTQRLAMSDPLTGLLNRRAFVEAMARSLAAFERHEDPLAIVLLDIDHFKQVNDRHGHDGGDAVLVGVAELLRGMARKSDVVARWGGEEFVVGLGHTSLAGAAVVAERIRGAIMGHPFRVPGGAELDITASVGVAAPATATAESLDALIARADEAMYAAKAAGRNRCEIHRGSRATPP